MKPANVKRAIGIYLACINLAFLGIAVKLGSGGAIALCAITFVWALVAFRHALFGGGVEAAENAQPEPARPRTKGTGLVLVCMSLGLAGFAVLIDEWRYAILPVGILVWVCWGFRHAFFGIAPSQPKPLRPGTTSPLAVLLLATPAVALIALVYVLFVRSPAASEVAAPAPDASRFSEPEDDTKKRDAKGADSVKSGAATSPPPVNKP